MHAERKAFILKEICWISVYSLLMQLAVFTCLESHPTQPGLCDWHVYLNNGLLRLLALLDYLGVVYFFYVWQRAINCQICHPLTINYNMAVEWFIMMHVRCPWLLSGHDCELINSDEHPIFQYLFDKLPTPFILSFKPTGHIDTNSFCRKSSFPFDAF